MKRLISIILGSLTLLPAMAQLESGYYRIQNVDSKSYLSIANNKVDEANKNSIKNNSGGTIYALKTIKEEDAVIDPSTILYINVIGTTKGSAATKYEVNFSGQGMQTSELLPKGTHLNITIRNNETVYRIEGTHDDYPSARLSLNESYSSFDKCGFINTSGTTQTWDIKPINNTDHFLGIKPTISIEGKHYATFFTGFPYKISSGMKAYYVKRYWVGSDISNQMAEMVEIENGIVPASTPVILECSSTDAANNKVEPLKASEVSASITGNLLQGIFFSFIKWGANNNENQKELGKQLKNVTSYDSESMRMLGTTQDGNLGFVKASDSQLLVSNQGKYIPANKVYLFIPSSSNDDIKLVDTATYTAGIDDIVSDPKTTQKGVYTLYGVQISNSSDTEGLPSGLYIINGKKVIVK